MRAGLNLVIASNTIYQRTLISSMIKKGAMTGILFAQYTERLRSHQLQIGEVVGNTSKGRG